MIRTKATNDIRARGRPIDAPLGEDIDSAAPSRVFRGRFINRPEQTVYSAGRPRPWSSYSAAKWP